MLIQFIVILESRVFSLFGVEMSDIYLTTVVYLNLVFHLVLSVL